MAKMKPRYRDIKKKISPWFANKIQTIRKTAKPLAARANKWGAPSGVALIIFITLTSLFWPKNDFQLIKEKLIRNPYNFEANLELAERFLENNQIDEAERSLLLAQKAMTRGYRDTKILGEETNSRLEKLWQKKYYSKPEDIRKLITAWEKVVEKKPNYRDGYLQLAILHYELYQNDRARGYLQQAIDLDPNYEPTKGLEKIILK